MTEGPRRRSVDNHVHTEYWTTVDHHRFEDRLSREVNQLREDLDAIGQRLTLILGGIAILAFIFPFLLPLIERAFGLPPT
jgi:hypothetical protein